MADVVPVALRATTRRAVFWVLFRAGVAARADEVPVFVARRADTERVDARGADDVVALRADVAPDVFRAERATTRRVDVPFAGVVRVKTFICAFDCDGLTPGFKFVRIVLFIYGYRLLYVFALT